MKIVKEHIFEKFSEDSDPIYDIGIGLEHIYKNLKKGDVLQLKNDITFYEGNKPTDGYPKGAYIVIIDIQFGPNSVEYNDTIEYIYTEDIHTVRELLQRELETGPYSTKSWGIDFDFFKERFNKLDTKKILKENLNEKFEEDSDPIDDMGIGIYVNRNFNDSDEYYEWLYNYAAEHIIGVPLKDAINPTAWPPIVPKYFEKLLQYSEKYITVDGSKDELRIFWAKDVRQFVLYKESLHEKFTEDSDPIYDMGIGAAGIIKNWKTKIKDEDRKRAKENKLMWYVVPLREWRDSSYLISNVSFFEAVDILIEAGQYKDKNGKLDFPEYVHSILESLNLTQFLEKEPTLSRASTWISYYIKPQYLQLFREAAKKDTLHEAFIEDSDPIADMGIGITASRVFKNPDELIDYIITALPVILNKKEIPNDILTYKNYEDGGILPDKLFWPISDFIQKCRHVDSQGRLLAWGEFSIWPAMLKQKLISLGYKKIGN